MAVDILPASIPLDASKGFSDALIPYLTSVIQKYQKGSSDMYSDAIDKATLAVNGQLTEPHRWLHASVTKSRVISSFDNGVASSASAAIPDGDVDIAPAGIVRKKRVLMLGSGMVARPAVAAIAKRTDVQLLIGIAILLLARVQS